MTKRFGNIELGYEIEPKGKSRKCVSQVHGSVIVPFSSSEIPEADGIFTFEKGQSIHVYTADCIPLLFFSRSEEAPILAAHCGWRGAMHRIASKSLEHFKGLETEVVVGPSILSCCFEVKADFVDALKNEGHLPEPFLRKRENRMYFDLVEFVIMTQLEGVKVHKDWSRCTVCSEPRLPSYRRNKSTDPQIRSWILKAL